MAHIISLLSFTSGRSREKHYFRAFLQFVFFKLWFSWHISNSWSVVPDFSCPSFALSSCYLVGVQSKVWIQQLPGIVVGVAFVDFIRGVPDLHVHGSVGHAVVLEALRSADRRRRTSSSGLPQSDLVLHPGDIKRSHGGSFFWRITHSAVSRKIKKGLGIGSYHTDLTQIWHGAH